MKDLIYRQNAIKAVMDLPDCDNGYSDTYDKAQIIRTLEEVPSAQRKGKWLLDEERGANGLYAICSACDELIYITGDFKYCPNCGAKMEEEQCP